jgi:hypothetical protein
MFGLPFLLSAGSSSAAAKLGSCVAFRHRFSQNARQEMLTALAEFVFWRAK